MSDRTSLEIEFKCLINKEQYESLLKEFNIKPQDIKEQINYYFDTKDLELRKKHIMCRIRQNGEQYKITVKTKNENNDNVENHYFLTTNEGKEMIKNGMDGKYANTSSFLSNVATLKTERVSFPYEGGKLFFDKSTYGKITDYEIEYEVIDKIKGEAIFNTFLDNHKITHKEAISKSQRCFKEAGLI